MLPPVYVISLESPSGRERMHALSSHLADLGIPYTIQPGVDGRALSATERHRLATATCRAVCTPSTIGCAASHALVWQRVVRGSAPYAIVLEDDVAFVDDAVAHLDAVLPRLPADLDVLFLGCFLCASGADSIAPHEQGVVPVRQFAGTHAYLVTRRGAQTLLDHAFPVKFHVDTTMSVLAASGLLRAYALRSDIAHQRGGETTSANVGDTPGFPNAVYDVARHVRDAKGQSLFFYLAMPLFRVGPYDRHVVITGLDLAVVLVGAVGLSPAHMASIIAVDAAISRRVRGVGKAIALYVLGRLVYLAWTR